MIKIISYNLNGIRAALKKNLINWIEKVNPDIICFQEIKAMKDQIPTEIFEKLGFHHYWYPAKKKGYSGVAILTKRKPMKIAYGTGISHIDEEGRVIRIDYDNFSVISLYLPSGTNIQRLGHKFKFMDDFQNYINKLKKKLNNIVICGDYNICHKHIDIHDPIRNKNVSGFLPEERLWLDNFMKKGFIDWLILEQPDEVIADGVVMTTDYELTVKTGDLGTLAFDTQIEVSKVKYKVRNVRKIDDGTLCRISLTKV